MMVILWAKAVKERRLSPGVLGGDLDRYHLDLRDISWRDADPILLAFDD
jgi:hypothetical protein